MKKPNNAIKMSRTFSDKDILKTSEVFQLLRKLVLRKSQPNEERSLKKYCFVYLVLDLLKIVF